MHKLLLGVLVVLAAGPAFAQEPAGWGSAVWVWDQPNANQVAQSDDVRYLRRSFELGGPAKKAELWITADNHYVAFVNGQKIGADGQWSSIEKYDVAKHLVAGKNVLAIEARNEGGVAGVIARLAVSVAGKSLIVGTDAKTKIGLDAPADWRSAAFDDTRWASAVVLGEPGIEPWHITGAAAASKSDDVSAVDPKIKGRLSAEEQRQYFKFPEGFELELVAADPLVINPITMALDDKGRIYVSESHTYRYGPSGSPVKPFANPVIRLDPDGKGFKRTLVADGFDDPVMGIAIKGDKLWLTANNFLYQYDLPEDGKAINKKTLLVDKNKAWNPFGMFVLEWGPDGLLYMSVGDHRIDIHGPDGAISGAGNSGIIMRMRPDGTKMERLTHGFRVPYSFEYDPFGQLWLLSNGEGNPNRFARVIEGVDYHCYSRPVGNDWLAGNHPLAPPTFETPRGAHTQLLRYYSSAFPASYQGSLFLCNWGAHGFSGVNRAIFRYVPDEKGQIVTKEPLLSCSDPHFRPSHIHLDPDGNLLVSDWYGRDDESDMTGRIWRLKYVGKDRPVVKHKLDSPEWAKDHYAISALDSPNHLIREKATREFVTRAKTNAETAISVLGSLGGAAADDEHPIGASYALWTLAQIDTPESRLQILCGALNPDPRIGRLAYELARRYQIPHIPKKPHQQPAVHLAFALAQAKTGDIRTGLLETLTGGAAADQFLRYEAAFHLAKVADEAAFAKLLASDDENVRLAGMLTIDIACYEKTAARPLARAALGKALADPGKADLLLLLKLAELNGDASLNPALEKLIARDDLPVAAVGKAVMVLKSRGGLSTKLSAAAGKRLIEALEKGAIRVSTPEDQLAVFEFLSAEGPTEFALHQVAGQLRAKDPTVRRAAHVLARKFGPKANGISAQLWPAIFDPKGKSESRIEMLATLARVDASPDAERWQKLLMHADPMVRTEAVRWWRLFKGKQGMADTLVRQVPELLKTDAHLGDDLASVLGEVQPGSVKTFDLPTPEADKAVLGKNALADLSALSAAERQKRALLGEQVFDRAGCMRCHTTATQTTLLAPSLKGIAAQKLDYLVESVLYPSKIIKTGFETETITTRDGKVLSGLVKDEGTMLRVLNLDRDVRVAKADVEERTVQRISVMPEGQEAQLSRREFVDLIAYLATLR